MGAVRNRVKRWVVTLAVQLDAVDYGRFEAVRLRRGLNRSAMLRVLVHQALEAHDGVAEAAPVTEGVTVSS
jgi:hypothetical protein